MDITNSQWGKIGKNILNFLNFSLKTESKTDLEPPNVLCWMVKKDNFSNHQQPI